MLAPVGDALGHLVHRLHHRVVFGDRQAPGAQPLVRLGLPRDVEAGPRADAVAEHRQRAGRGDPRVLLPQRASRRVARVRERRLARRDERGVQLLEPGEGKEDFAAHLDEVRDVVAAVVAELFRHIRDRPHVEGDVLPHPSVAAGGRAGQPALLVGEVHGQAVDLQLGQPAHRPARVALGAIHPGREILGGEDVVEAQHAFGVLDRREPGGKAAADPLRRGLGRDQRRMLCLERLEFLQQPVELAVGHRRRIEDVVAELRVGDGLRQLGMPRGGLGGDIERGRVAQRVHRDLGAARLRAGGLLAGLGHRVSLDPGADRS